jgi:hypothetical protein
LNERTQLIVTLYKQLDELLKLYRTQPISTRHIQHTLNYSQSIIRALKSEPDCLIGQLSLNKNQLPYATNLIFNSCVLVALVSARNKVNDSCAQQLVCAAITAYSFNISSLENADDENNDLSKNRFDEEFSAELLKFKFEVWQTAFSFGRDLDYHKPANKRPIESTNILKTIINFVHFVAIDITPKHQHIGLSFAQSIKNQLNNCPISWQRIIEPLLLYPTIYPPGSVVKLENHKMMLVLSSCKQGLITKETHSPSSHPLLTPFQQVNHVLPARKVANVAVSQLWWDKNWFDFHSIIPDLNTPFLQSFRLDKPPQVLLNIQHQLNQHDVNIEQMATLINAEKALVAHIQHSATLANRKRLPVQDVKHALMMHGYERTNSILIQQSLLLRLNQNYFPLQEQLIQFTRLRSAIAKKLCHQDALLGESAATLACFANTGLFTCAALKTRTQWQPEQSRRFCITSLFEADLTKALFENPITLAKSWQQKPMDIRVLRYSNIMPEKITATKEIRKLSSILGLSLVASRAVFFAEKNDCIETKNYIRQALKIVSIEQNELQSIQKKCAIDNHVYCSLNSKIAT